jgi:hypothetical protein
MIGFGNTRKGNGFSSNPDIETSQNSVHCFGGKYVLCVVPDLLDAQDSRAYRSAPSPLYRPSDGARSMGMTRHFG